MYSAHDGNLGWAGLVSGMELVQISHSKKPTSPDGDLGWAGCSLSAKPTFPDAFPPAVIAPEKPLEKPGSGKSSRSKSGRPRGSNPRKGHGYRKMWEQVTQVGSGREIRQDTFALSEVSVEDLVRKVLGLTVEEPVGPAVAAALTYLDSRALAALLKELAKCGRISRAAELFDWLRTLPTCNELAGLCDVYTYTTAISLCGQRKDLRRALEMMAELRARGVVCNVHTFSAFMNVCTKCGELQLAVDVFGQMGVEGVVPNVVTYNTLIDVYGKLGDWGKAVEVLEIARQQGLRPEIRTYNTAIIACNMCNQPLEALKVYQHLLDAGELSTATTCTALISTYSKAGMYQKAFETYDEMVVRGLERVLLTYVALFRACEMAGTWELALKYFRDMEREGCWPNAAIFNSLIAILCHRGEWQTGNEIYKKMITQTSPECKPDITTWTPLLNAYDRAGQWQEVCNLLDSVLQSSHRVDPAFYHAAIDVLWCTGVAQVQVKAMQFFNSISKQSRVQLAVQTALESNTLTVIVPPHSVGCAIIAIYSWLLETRIRLDEDGNYLVASMISLLVGQGRTTKDTAAQSVKNSLAAIFESVGAPLRYVKFLSPGEEGAQPYQCTGYSLRLWLQDPDSFARIAALVCCPEQITDPAAFLQLSTQRKFTEAYNVVGAFERTHELDYEVMGEEYISHRPQMVDLTCKLGMQLELKDVTVHDAVLLMDRVMSTGAKFQEGIAVVAAAAFLHISAEGVDMAKMKQSSHLCEVFENFPHGAMDDLVKQIKAALGHDIASFSAMRLAMSYVEWLGYDKAPKWGAASLVHIRFLLHRCLVSSNFLNFRPSVIAASIIYYDRFVRGWVPFWPAALARITGYEDLSTPEMSGAIQAVFDMKNLASTPQMADVALGL